MIKNYKCSCCTCWNKEKEIDHISFSDDHGNLRIYIQCKNCKKKGCLINCKYMPVIK